LFLNVATLSFALMQKKQKIKALTSYATKYKLQLKDLNLPCRQAGSLALKQQIFFNALACILLDATKFKALASLKCAHSFSEKSN
jgi:hypothetical protein